MKDYTGMTNSFGVYCKGLNPDGESLSCICPGCDKTFRVKLFLLAKGCPECHKKRRYVSDYDKRHRFGRGGNTAWDALSDEDRGDYDISPVMVWKRIIDRYNSGESDITEIAERRVER